MTMMSDASSAPAFLVAQPNADKQLGAVLLDSIHVRLSGLGCALEDRAAKRRGDNIIKARGLCAAFACSQSQGCALQALPRLACCRRRKPADIWAWEVAGCPGLGLRFAL